MDCPFCVREPTRIIFEMPLVAALWDAYPVSPGHTLIVPKRHVQSYFALTADEHHQMHQALLRVREHIEHALSPSGYNFGLNDGAAAGQTVMHVHCHLIPRYTGDIADPRGGIRWVIPAKAQYWT